VPRALIKFILECWWGRFNMDHCFWPDTLLKNLYNIQTIMWVNSASWFVKV